MTPQNLAFINATHPGDNVNFRTKLRHLVHNQCGNLSAYQRENMQRIMREEWFGPGYATDLWCPSCVMSMAKIMHEQVEKYFVEEERKRDEVLRKAAEALATTPLPIENIAANFPKHDGEPREQLNIPTAENSHLHTTSKPKRKKK
jgi:hypothetical protein